MSFYGIDILPHWRVLPPSVAPESRGPLDQLSVVRIKSGRGFGVGTHETTQLCMLALAHLLRTSQVKDTMLDFGAGSGILAIAAALSGVRVEAVEIDALALDNARENVRLNGVESFVELRTHLSEPVCPFDFVFANILSSVLLEFAAELCARLAPQGTLVLSGLTSTDVPAILARYRPLLPGKRAQIYERGSWRAVVFAVETANQA